MGNEQQWLKDKLFERARQLGIEDLGFCGVAPFTRWAQAAPASLRASLHGDPREILPEARTIIVAFRRYDTFAPWPGGHGQILEYYVESSDVRDGTEQLAQWLRQQGWQADGNPALPHRAAALRTGRGVRGWNQQFIHDTLGTLVRTDAILTDAPLPLPSEQNSDRTCEGCGLCVDACPTEALSPGGGFRRSLCLREYTLGSSVVPKALRRAMGSRLLGCANCTIACPHAKPREQPIPSELLSACRIDNLLLCDSNTRHTLSAFIGSNYARKGRLQAQAALIAGNSGDRAHIPALADLLRTHSAVNVRCHSSWALGELGGDEARRALREALESESDEVVRGEILESLGEGDG